MALKNQLPIETRATAAIDFLPPRFHEEYAQRKIFAWRIVIVTIFAVALPVASLYQYRMRLAVENELTIVEREYEKTQLEQRQLAALLKTLETLTAEADLVTWLNHPWSRSQILAAVVAPLPDSITLEELQVVVETGGRKVPAGRHSETSRTDGPVDATPPGIRDKQRIAERFSGKTFVRITGRTTNNRQLHDYLAKLEKHNLFDKAELDSIERHSKDARRGSSARFDVLLQVTPAYGHPGGPTGPPQRADGELVTRIYRKDAS